MPLFDLFSRKKSCQLLVNVTGDIAEKYNYFMEFLTNNRAALGIISEIEQLYYGGSPFTLAGVASQYGELTAATRRLVEDLNGVAPGKYGELCRVFEGIDQEITPLLASHPRPQSGELVMPLEALGPDMVEVAGSKATNLATIHKFLDAPIPPGFVITARALELFLQETNLTKTVGDILGGLSPEAVEEVEEKSRTIQEIILQAQVPVALAEQILKAYLDLEAKSHPNVHLAMRSSAIGEDTEASFAGQYATELNVTRGNLLEAYKKVLASKYSPGAILYRRRFGLEDRDTHMCVAGVVMIDSRSSGVLYTVDPTKPESNFLKINSIWGLGEYLVSGKASPDEFFVDKHTGAVSHRIIARKDYHLVNLEGGGTRLEEVPEMEKNHPSLDDAMVQTLARYGLRLEEYFQSPQDVEWAVDQEGDLYFLQSRPLALIQSKPEEEILPQDFPGQPILLSGGQAASPGIALGRVFLADGDSARPLPDDAILVARTASPEYAKFMGRVKGIITDIGSVTSHLASVAREFRVPALFNAGQATSLLPEGQPITLVADRGTIYQGIVQELAAAVRPAKRHLFESPLHRRLRAFLDKVAPLNLTDPQDRSFSAAGCQTIHDVIRFAHEKVVREMFGLSEDAAGSTLSVKLTTDIPLALHLIDLGGGLKPGLTTCDEITADHLESLPMKAIWKGFCHPGITWTGSVAVDARNFMQLMAQGVMTGPENLPGGASYAILSREYLNLSAKFGYHFANLDALCSDTPEQNYISLQFAGGAGSYFGKSLRLTFLGNVLFMLGFKINVTGDLLEATLTGYDLKSMDNILNQMGRLLASSRLLDMAIANEAEMKRMIEAFFSGDYDFLNRAQEIRIPGFYTHTGNWKRVDEDGRILLLQDGSDYGSSLSSGVANFMGKMMGAKYQELLDNVEAYYYFPMAVAKDSEVADAILRVRAETVAGSIDQAGGLAFGIRNINNYFVLRINALEDNVILFEYINNRRFQRATVPKEIKKDNWYLITAQVSGSTLKGYVDNELLIDYHAERPLTGFVGLWTKADSVTYFDELCIEAGGRKQIIEF
ncbi:MAG: PEP/pyruvate-binding domain-containing protein [Desulfobaccales bacterium]